MVSFAHCAILIAIVSNASLISAETTANNPVRRVVSMLQMMSKKIAATGEVEEKQFDAFMCYCKNGGSTLEQSIADAETKIPQLESALKESGSKVLQMKADVEQGKIDRDAAKKSMQEATALREKEAATFAAYSAEANANIKAMIGAIAALEKGMGGAFIQTPSATLLQHVAASSDLEDSDRQMLMSFLSQGYAPQSGQITGILKQMQDTWTADLEKATEEEGTAKANYDGLMKAKTKEVEALQKMIETKTARIGEEGVAVVNMADDLEDTKNGLAEDSKFLADLDKNCAAKKIDWEVRQKMRSAELLALADTVKILTEDSALDMFKKTLPSPTSMSLMQIQAPAKELRGNAARALKAVGGDPRLKLLAMQLMNQKHFSFKKVLVMIEEMLKLCGQEQDADDAKFSSCNANIADADTLKHHLEDDITDINTDLDAKKSKLAELTEEIHTLAKKIKQSDAMVADATKLRKADHTDFEASRADDAAAKDLLAVAQNRLRKFYAPHKYKDTQDQPMQAALAFVQTIADPGDAPETFGEYKKSGAANDGVMAMLAALIADMEHDMQQNEAEEHTAQKEYEQTLNDAAETRRQDYNRLEESRGEKAGTEARIHKANRRHTETSEELGTVQKRLHTLHDSCDWLHDNFQLRKEARASEVEALQKSRSILSGAGAADAP